MMVTSGEGERGMELGRDTQGLQLYNILFPHKKYETNIGKGLNLTRLCMDKYMFIICMLEKLFVSLCINLLWVGLHPSKIHMLKSYLHSEAPRM